jgi:hypothetical protein
MNKLLLILFISCGLSNLSIAGVKDISIKCKGTAISTIWLKGGINQGNFLNKISWIDKSLRQFDSEGDAYIIAESANSVKVSFGRGFRNRDLLEDGVYKLYKTDALYYRFNKEISLDGKKGTSSFLIDREDGSIWEIKFEIEADRPLTYDVQGHPRDSSSRIVRDVGTFKTKYNGCKKFTQLF